MRTRTCPFCKEDIHTQALVCRYCRRDLPPMAQQGGKTSHGWLAAIVAAGIIASGAAFLAAEFLRERKNWLTEPARPPEPQNPPD
ncbi:MAG: hypothetical protein OEV89_09905 [Desulfobulbaceae bacterium]|nr:hypothetical protein [Desulfobulbaceae bacterium]HIJ91005.1 hypothetical protein [Deltaproteobacteria bacterium]